MGEEDEPETDKLYCLPKLIGSTHVPRKWRWYTDNKYSERFNFRPSSPTSHIMKFSMSM
jgi:hypothetical protein